MIRLRECIRAQHCLPSHGKIADQVCFSQTLQSEGFDPTGGHASLQLESNEKACFQ